MVAEDDGSALVSKLKDNLPINGVWFIVEGSDDE
jgi:hypothetical protein